MTYKILQKTNSGSPQIYARIDDDGISRLSCSEEYPEFKQWLAEGNTPLPADEPSEG